jgi:hypothetical protein
LAVRLLAHPEWHLTIEGHTDSSGTASQEYAAVAKPRQCDPGVSAEKKGMPENQLTAIGYGSGPSPWRTTGHSPAAQPIAGSNSS